MKHFYNFASSSPPLFYYATIVSDYKMAPSDYKVWTEEDVESYFEFQAVWQEIEESDDMSLQDVIARLMPSPETKDQALSDASTDDTPYDDDDSMALFSDVDESFHEKMKESKTSKDVFFPERLLSDEDRSVHVELEGDLQTEDILTDAPQSVETDSCELEKYLQVELDFTEADESSITAELSGDEGAGALSDYLEPDTQLFTPIAAPLQIDDCTKLRNHGGYDDHPRIEDALEEEGSGELSKYLEPEEPLDTPSTTQLRSRDREARWAKLRALPRRDSRAFRSPRKQSNTKKRMKYIKVSSRYLSPTRASTLRKREKYVCTKTLCA